MMFVPAVLILIAIAPVTTSVVSRGGPSCCNPSDIQFRFPPTVDTSLDADWIAPPPGWIYGNWKVRYSSRAIYQVLWNFEADTYPVLPTDISIPEGRNIDLTSFQTAITGNATTDQYIATAFGYDYPQDDIAPYVFQFRGEGSLATENFWEVLAWGNDKNGVQWRAEYESQTSTTGLEACLNVLSRVEDGPDPETYQQVLDTMRRTFASNSDLSMYASNITELPRDGRRVGLPPVACNAACMQNAVPTA